LIHSILYHHQVLLTTIMAGDNSFPQDPAVGVGFSDSALLMVSIGGFGLMAFLIYSIVFSRVQSAEELEKTDAVDGELDYEEELLKADVSTLNRAQRRARAKALMKRERRVHEEDGEGDDADAHNNLSRKERQKAAKAAERKERQILDAARQEEQRVAMQRAQEEKKRRLELEAIQAEEDRLRKEDEDAEQKQREWEEWNNFLKSPDGSESLTVEEWVKELEKGPCSVDLRPLSTRFDTSLEQVQQRINKLVRDGRVTGCLDESNSIFWFFTHDNLLALAEFIKNEGEVSLKDVSKAAGTILKQGVAV
jgi:DDRGK domain